MQEVIESHYSRLADKYDEFLSYSPEFVRALTSKMIVKLRLRPADRLVDLGCGTGMYARDIRRQVQLEHPILGVDPFEEMLAHIPQGNGIATLQMDALEFAASNGYVFDKVLMKEAVHHVANRPALFRCLYDRLPQRGRLLLVHVPPELDYPLFREALQRARDWHADPQELQMQLRAAGFRVEADALDYPHAIPRDAYFAMVRTRYMSLLSSFTDEELGEGLQEMEERHGSEETLRFVDHFDFLTAIK